MTLTNYEKGRSKEYRVKKKWESEGWTVLRTAGSHGEFDLIAIRGEAHDGWVDWPNREIVLIQAKSGKSAKRELKKLEPLRAKYDGVYSVRVELV